MFRTLRLFGAVAMAAAGLGAADMKQILAPTGTLRVTFLGGNPVQGRVDPSGNVSGPVADLTRELAKRAGVPFKVFPSAGVRDVMDTVKANNADLGFLAYDPARAMELNFSQPYALAYNSYIVLAQSPIRNVAEIDRAGVRVAAPTGDSGELYLSRTLKQAEVKSVSGLTAEAAEKMLRSGDAEAYATNRQRLTEMAGRFPGLRVLPDNFFAVEQSMIAAKDDAEKIKLIDGFIDSVRDSGWLRNALEGAKLSGVEVAPKRSR